MHFDTIIFDLDGTLVDTAGDLSASLNHALGTLGRPAIDPASVRQMVGRGARVLLQRGLAATGDNLAASATGGNLAASATGGNVAVPATGGNVVVPATDGTDAMLEAGIAAFMEHYAANIAVHSRPFEGVEPTLDLLAGQGLRLAICTNKPEGLARQLIGELGWEGRFAALLGSDSRPWRKPDPRHLHETLQQAGGQRAIFIGDSKTDADTALAAGVPLVLVSFGYSVEPVEELGADHVIHHFADLAATVAGIQAGFKPAPARGAA